MTIITRFKGGYGRYIRGKVSGRGGMKRDRDFEEQKVD